MMQLLKTLGKSFLVLLRAYCISFCILSVGYAFNNHIFDEKMPITFTFGYFGYIFMEGILVTGMIIMSIYGIVQLIKCKNEHAR